ncbi:MAG: site-specific DNA-methyltransferase [Deltaproteobacteria bacterium]|nr:site-specific DNA-methyltransferase [Deltaproteobacteria bacterium]
MNSILALSAAAPAMSPEADACRDVGAKPSLEPVTMARKPLTGNVAANVMQHGTGAINVDGCRVEGVPPSVPQPSFSRNMRAGFGASDGRNGQQSAAPAGRWPSNLIHDGSDEVVGLFPQTASGSLLPSHRLRASENHAMSGPNQDRNPRTAFGGDSGSAARFFYTAKASARDRGNHTKAELPLFGVEAEPWRNPHPTVKPVALMRYLVRLVTPPGGVVLDPFLGSGTTAIAALLEGRNFVGIERDPAHFATACDRVAAMLDDMGAE